MSQPAKVLFLVNSLRIGGTERNVALFCRRIDRSRFEPEVWLLKPDGAYEAAVKESGIRIRTFSRRWSRSPWFALKMALEISRTDAKLIHAFLPTIAAYAAIARRWYGVRQPMVLSVGQSFAGRTERWLLRLCSRTFDWLIANSPSAAALAQTLGFSVDRMSLIPNGHEVEASRRSIDRTRARETVGVGTQERMLLYVGRLTVTKRFCDAIAATAELAEGHPVKMGIVGDGPERGALEADVSRRCLTGKVNFVGQRHDVLDLLSAADYFVFPSETEGLPNALIEACLARLPIVACRVGGVTDVVQHGQTALLVPPRCPAELAAAVRQLMCDPAEADRLATSAWTSARSKFGIEQSLDALYDVYDRLLDRAQPGRANPVKAVASPG